MNSLENARKEIERIDKEMAGLFEQRMNAAKQVAEYKKERGLPILDASREKQLIERNLKYLKNPEMESYFTDFCVAMMGISKQYQKSLMNGIRVSYSGIEGSFASISARKIFPEAERVPYMNFKEAYEAVVKGDCDFAVLPIENSYAGEVGQVCDLIFEGDLFVNGIYELGVSQCLLGVKGACINDLKTVVSHPQALEQCNEYIYTHKFRTVQAENTARAALDVAQKGDISVGAIASAETAELYGLDILEKNINKSNINTTRFAVLSRLRNTRQLSDELSTFILMFIVKHEAGSLAKALSIIGDHGYNMRVIRSRPLKAHNWEYYFYGEIEGKLSSDSANAMLKELEEHCEKLKVVGSYKPSTLI